MSLRMNPHDTLNHIISWDNFPVSLSWILLYSTLWYSSYVATFSGHIFSMNTFAEIPWRCCNLWIPVLDCHVSAISVSFRKVSSIAFSQVDHSSFKTEPYFLHPRFFNPNSILKIWRNRSKLNYCKHTVKFFQ